MYIPKFHKKEIDNEVKDFIIKNSFGIIVGLVQSRILATHIPLILTQNKDGADVLVSHISKANPQLKDIDKNQDILVIFQGPHTYISSSWYDHENVPTYNYIAVHVYGKVRIIEGDELMNSLKMLVDKFEVNSKNKVSVEKMTPSFLNNEIKGITGIEITMERIEAAYKLSQNRDDKNYEAIISELNKSGNDNATAIASEMKKLRP